MLTDVLANLLQGVGRYLRGMEPPTPEVVFADLALQIRELLEHPAGRDPFQHIDDFAKVVTRRHKDHQVDVVQPTVPFQDPKTTFVYQAVEPVVHTIADFGNEKRMSALR